MNEEDRVPVSSSRCLLCDKDGQKGEYCYHLETYFNNQYEKQRMTLQTCKKCNEEKSVLEFYRYTVFRTKPFCKECLADIRKDKKLCQTCQKSITIKNMLRHEKSERHKRIIRESQKADSKNGD
jgi:hypothetical protein